MHEAVSIDSQTALRAAPRCAGAVLRVFERYPHEYENFARQASRPIAPREFAARCPGRLVASPAGAPEVLFPSAQASLLIDPGLPRAQEIVLEARSSSEELRFLVDERWIATVHAPFRLPWRLEPGAHGVRVATPEGAQSELVQFEVR
jgi:membrane carboxypeptidase/penicillin-binding protein PbpC